MKPLTTEKRATILQLLCEGMSVRGVSRVTGAATNSILALIEKAGEACLNYQDENLRNLPCKNIQLDEMFCFIGCKGTVKEKIDSEHYGDVWAWIAIDSDTKLRVTWHIGDRDQRSANALCYDLARRIPADAQVTSDGLAIYKSAMRGAMPLASFGQLVKTYSQDNRGGDTVTGAIKMPISNDPDPAFISTSHIEASNLHMRMQNRRYARRTNAHSKKLENHGHMVAILFLSYNFIRRHATLKQTPAQAAGVAAKPWTMQDVVAMMDEYHDRKLNAQFEAAFAARVTPPRTHPKSYAPTPRAETPLPWYLDPESSGPPEGSELP